MGTDKKQAPPPAVVRCCPAAFALPSADPAALALECLLRLQGVRYTTAPARLEGLALVAPGEGGAGPETFTGLRAAMQRALPEEPPAAGPGAAADVAAIEVLATHCVFPAVVFLTHFDARAYDGIRKSVVPKVASLWESAWGSYRDTVLAANAFMHTGTRCPAPAGASSVAALRKMGEVGAEVLAALTSLETLHVSRAPPDAVSVLGGAQRGRADALAFAAVSCVVHADWAASAALQGLQRQVRSACPRLVAFAEALRTELFVEYSGTYTLRAASTGSGAAAAAAASADDLYRPGRLRALLWTGGFAALYFIVVNADVIVSVLEELAEEEEEEELEQVDANEADAAAESREPKEL